MVMCGGWCVVGVWLGTHESRRKGKGNNKRSTYIEGIYKSGELMSCLGVKNSTSS